MAEGDGRAIPEPDLDRVADLFATAIELPDRPAQHAFLAEVRQRDPALADQLASLLTAHHSDPDFLSVPVTRELAEVFADHLDDALIGKRVGSWQVDSVLHQGGMGTVYNAHRVEVDFEQHAALKVIRFGLRDAELVRRFTQERQLLARLEHPNIARLLDGGTTSNGLPFLVMEHVRGETIDAWCDRTRPDVASLLEVVFQICSAIEFAHQNLVIHQDIKPANILVTDDGTAKLLDFGIADLERQASDEDSTASGAILLTPDYASPEQFRGAGAGTATDTYSLGVLLYRLLTGKAPYRVEPGLSREEAYRVVVESEPVPLSVAMASNGRRLPSRVGDLDAVIHKAMAREPQDRHRSVAAFAEDLRRYRDGLPVLARPATLGYRTQRFIGRNWAALGATAMVALALVTGLAAALWQAGVAERQRDVARAEAATAASAVTFLKTVLGSADPWRDSDPAATVDDVILVAETQLDSILGDQPAARAYVLAALGEVGAGRGDLERADRFTGRAVAILRDSLNGDAAQGGAILHARVLALHELGRLDEGRDLALEAVRYFEASPESWLALAAALNQLGALQIDLGDVADAEQTLVRAAQLHRDQGGERLELAAIYNNLAVALASQPDRLEEAAAAYSEALRLAEQNGASAPRLATLHANQANVYRMMSRFEDAERTFGRAISLLTTSLGADHQATLTASASLGSLYEAAGMYDRAVETLNRPLELAQSTLPAGHPTTAYIESVLASALCQRDNPDGWDDGLTAAQSSALARRAALGADHWAVASADAVVGHCLVRSGNAESGAVVLEQAWRTLRDQRGEDHELTLRAARWLAEADTPEIR